MLEPITLAEVVEEASAISRGLYAKYVNRRAAWDDFRRQFGPGIAKRRETAIVEATQVGLGQFRAAVSASRMEALTTKGISRCALISIIATVCTTKFQRHLINGELASATKLIFKSLALGAISKVMVDTVLRYIKDNCENCIKMHTGSLAFIMATNILLIISTHYLGKGYDTLNDYLKGNADMVVGSSVSSCLTYALTMSCPGWVAYGVSAVTIEYLRLCKTRYDKGQTPQDILRGALEDFYMQTSSMFKLVLDGISSILRKIMCLDLGDEHEGYLAYIRDYADEPRAQQLLNMSIPDGHEVFLCHITENLLRDPVVVFGFIYDRETINAWMSRGVQATDPRNPGQPMTHADIEEVPARFTYLLGHYIRLRSMEMDAGPAVIEANEPLEIVPIARAIPVDEDHDHQE